VGLLALVSLAHPGHAADFACAAGDVACLITAINTANANGEANTLTLEAGIYTLTTVDNTTDGPNGLPLVTSTLTIQGAGAEVTSIERAPSAPRLRLLHVAATGGLTLEEFTVRGGVIPVGGGGGGLFNRGVLALARTTVSHNAADRGGGLLNTGGLVTIARSTIRENDSVHDGGGICVSGGAVTILRSTLAGNFADGGGALALGVFPPPFESPSTMVITESAIVDNESFVQLGGGLLAGSSGGLMVTNTTIARNRILSSFGGGGTGVESFGTSILTNCTVTENSSPGGFTDGGVSGAVALQNTLVALNTGNAGRSADCHGAPTALGNNLIGDPTSILFPGLPGCSITLQPTDRTGDPGLATFRDNGRPGNGHFPLRPTSQAIDAGNNAVCPRTDQLGRLRLGPCDIGALEFRHRDNRQHEGDPAAVAQASQ
jgi:hypothetical protein